MPGRPRRLFFAVGVAVAFAGALELAARCFVDPVALPVLIAPLESQVNLIPDQFFRAHPTLLWELRPNLNVPSHAFGDVTNADGLRMRRDVGPKDGRLRVACFGDSCTYGLGLSVDDAWPSILGRDEGLDVINAAVPGYSSYQGAVMAELRCPEWKPDVVVVEFGINDALAWMNGKGDKVVAMTDEERAPHVRVASLLRKSVLLGWLASKLAVPEPRPVAKSILDEAVAPPGAPDPYVTETTALYRNGVDRLTARVTPEQYRTNILRIARCAPYAIVLLWPRRRTIDPTPTDTMSLERLAPYRTATQSVGNDFIEFLNLAEPLVASRMTADEAYLDSLHGTPAMSRLVASAVREKIRSRLHR